MSNTLSSFSTKKLIILLVPLVLMAGVAIALSDTTKDSMSEVAHTHKINQYSGQQSGRIYQHSQNIPEPVHVTIRGTYTCLPHRDADGPQTLECAFGVRDEATGEHYAVNTQLMSSTVWMEIPTGARVRIEGVVTPIENLSTDHWQKYDIVGIMSATSMTQLE